MAKKKTGITLLAFSLILIALGGLIFSVAYFSKPSAQTVLGVSNVNIYNEGSKVIITATPNSEAFVVDLTKDELNQKLEENGFTVERGVKVSLSLTKFEERWPLLKEEGDNIYVLDSVDTGNLPLVFLSTKANVLKECSNRISTSAGNVVSGYLEDQGMLSISNLHCIYRAPIGTIGIINGVATDEFNVKVDVTGQPSASITRNQQTASFANGAIKVSFEDLLVAPEELRTVPFKLYWTDGAFQFLISDDALNKQSDALTVFQRQADSYTLYKGSAYETLLDTYNKQIYYQVLKNRNSEFGVPLVKSLNLQTSSGDSNKGELRVTTSPTRYPLLRIEVDGTFLGIQKLSGEPDITKCTSDISTKAGRDQELKGSFTVRNIGTGEGTFNIAASCTNANMDLVSSSKVIVDAGSTESVDVLLTASSTKPGNTEKGTCTIKVTDKNSGKSDSCTFKASVEFATTVCEADQVYCSKDRTAIQKCNAEGDASDLFKTCASDEECGYKDGEIQCVKKGLDIFSGGGDIGGDDQSSSSQGSSAKCKPWLSLFGKTLIPNVWCELNAFFAKFKLIFAILAGLLGGILALSFVYSLLSEVSDKARWITTLIVAVIAGALIGVLAYVYFWLCIIIIIIAAIIRLVIPL